MKRAIAICCSDLHLSLRKPACRADKEDWLLVQSRYLTRLRDLELQLRVPVIIAGDIFDHWNTPPELLNFAFDSLPVKCYCIPGQHDLPNHSLREIHRSGYGVLVLAGRIVDLQPRGPLLINSNGMPFYLHGFPWGIEPLAVNRASFNKDETLHVAVVHRYVWTSDAVRYPGADEKSLLSAFKKVFNSYDSVVIGDNHKGWIRHRGNGNTEVLNCGTFIRRKSDEIEFNPSIGVLYSDGTIERKYQDCSLDRFHVNAKERDEAAMDLQAFIDGLEKLGEHGLDFRTALENFLRRADLDRETKKMVLQALDNTESEE